MAFDYGCFGAHTNKSILENSKIEKYEVLSALNSIRILLKLLQRLKMPDSYVDDNLNGEIYSNQMVSDHKESQRVSYYYDENIKTKLISIVDFFNKNIYKNTQFYIPIYQRGYS